jgi:hypothetical protein
LSTAIRSTWLWLTRTPTGIVSLSDIPRRRDLSSSRDNATLPKTMPDSNLVTKDNQTVEMGSVYTGDETELARMGYKQELKCVQFNLSVLVFRCLQFIARRDMTLMQVRWSRNDYA